MTASIRPIVNLHRFLLGHLFYPLLLSSFLAWAALRFRIFLTGDNTYRFLLWNLFLAWIPYLCSVGMSVVHARAPKRPWLLIPLGILWFLFFPNAPYILTDLIHLQQFAPLAWWYDLGLVLLFSLTGCFLAVVSLHIVHSLLQRFIGPAWSWLVALFMIGVCGIGIYLGRVVRWNSWDFFIHPRSIVRDVVTPLLDPFGNKLAIGVSLMFSSLLLVCYVTFVSARSATYTDSVKGRP
jgi:uncharacterized membrane protein